MIICRYMHTYDAAAEAILCIYLIYVYLLCTTSLERIIQPHV